MIRNWWEFIRKVITIDKRKQTLIREEQSAARKNQTDKKKAENEKYIKLYILNIFWICRKNIE